MIYKITHGRNPVGKQGKSTRQGTVGFRKEYFKVTDMYYPLRFLRYTDGNNGGIGVKYRTALKLEQKASIAIQGRELLYIYSAN